MQMFDSVGNKLGTNNLVSDNLDSNDHQQDPKITSDSLGRFVIGWTDYNDVSIDSYFQLYNSDGSKNSINKKIAGIGYEKLSVICKRENGDFIIVYGDDIGLTFPQYCQRFDSSGQIIGQPYLLTTYPVDDVLASGVSIFKDRVIATWSDERTGNFDIYCNIRSFTNPDSTVGINTLSNQIPNDFVLYQLPFQTFFVVVKIIFNLIGGNFFF